MTIDQLISQLKMIKEENNHNGEIAVYIQGDPEDDLVDRIDSVELEESITSKYVKIVAYRG